MERFQERKIEIPRAAQYCPKRDCYFIITNRQIGRWDINPKTTEMKFTTIGRLRESYGRLSFTCFVFHPSGSILAGVGGNKPVSRPRRGLPRQTINFGYIRIGLGDETSEICLRLEIINKFKVITS